MSDLDAAALKLVGFTLAFLLILFAVRWLRRPRLAPGAPRARRLPSLPKLTRTADPEPEPVEIAPARLARISARPSFEPLPEPDSDAVEAVEAVEAAPTPPLAATDEPAEASAANEAPPTIVDAVEVDTPPAEIAPPDASPPVLAPARAKPGGGIRLVPQIDARDPILTRHWIGGRPRLPAAVPWPQIDGSDGDFVAQVACDALPTTLWDGLGPRTGWLAFFAHPATNAATALHLPEDGPPRDPPRAVGGALFHPFPGRAPDLTPLAVRAFPEWPVEIAAEGQAMTEGADRSEPTPATGYDIADPAFHPFDWAGMKALGRLLESRLPLLQADPAAPVDASDELIAALAEAAALNGEAADRAREIIGIIGEAGDAGGFSPADAAAVMTALHAIRWTRVNVQPDADGGEDRVEVLAMPLTRHHPDADLWVGDYLAVLADHARHHAASPPDGLSLPMRALFEPMWRSMTAAAPAMGGLPSFYTHGFDEERDALMLEIPVSGLTSIGPAEGKSVALAMRKADLAAGNFATLRVLTGN